MPTAGAGWPRPPSPARWWALSSPRSDAWATFETQPIRVVRLRMSSEMIAANHPMMVSKSIYRSVQDPKYQQVVYQSKDMGGSAFSPDFDIANQKCTGPICLSKDVSFAGVGKVVRFSGAGARLEEHSKQCAELVADPERLRVPRTWARYYGARPPRPMPGPPLLPHAGSNGVNRARSQVNIVWVNWVEDNAV